jgi:hypothetical protein
MSVLLMGLRLVEGIDLVRYEAGRAVGSTTNALPPCKMKG